MHNAEDDSPWLPSLEQADAMQLDPHHVGLADSQQVSEYLLESFLYLPISPYISPISPLYLRR